MYIYFAIPIVPILCYFIRPKQKRFMFFSILFVLFFISTFRNNMMGTDYNSYIYYFNRIANGESAYFHERGYVLFNSLLSRISDQYWILAAGINILLFVPLSYYLKETVHNSPYWIVAVLVFILNPYMYLQTSFNSLRQCCSIGILFCAALQLRKEKYLIFTLLVLLAAQFHRISYIVILLPLLSKIKWTRKVWLITTFASAIFSVTLLPQLLSLISPILRFSRRYQTYSASLLNQPIYIIFIFLYLLATISQYDFLAQDMDFKPKLDFHLLCTVLLFFAVQNDMVYRVRMLFAFIELPYIPKLFERIDTLKQTNRTVAKGGEMYKILHILYYLFFWFGYIIYLYIKQDPHYIPFTFCF